ncbi:MAG: helix-turn-helix domain-containing protein [Lysobacterales bacterium]
MSQRSFVEFDVLTEAEAAAFLRTKPDTLRHWRTRKSGAVKGPAWIKASKRARVLYLKSDLVAWLERNRHDPAQEVT